jgi:hypothetical protein
VDSEVPDCLRSYEVRIATVRDLRAERGTVGGTPSLTSLVWWHRSVLAHHVSSDAGYIDRLNPQRKANARCGIADHSVRALSARLVTPIAAQLQVHDVGGINFARLLGIAFIILACFAAGLFASTRVAQQLVDGLERAILSNLPGYSMISNLRPRRTH